MANRLVDRTGTVFARLSVIENSGADPQGQTPLALPMLMRQ